MFNLPDHSPEPGSYVDLLKRVTQHVQQSKVGNQILEVLQKTIEQELVQQKIVLSRAERARLTRQVTKSILNDLLANMDNEK